MYLFPTSPTSFSSRPREIILPLRGIFFLFNYPYFFESLNVFHSSMTFIIIDVPFGEKKNKVLEGNRCFTIYC